MTDEHKNAPETVREIGIHLKYMTETLDEIKGAIKDSPTRKEFDTLTKRVDGAVTKKEFKIGLSTVTISLSLIGAILVLLDRIKG